MKQVIYSPRMRWVLFFSLLIVAIPYVAHGVYRGAFDYSCDLQHHWLAGQMVNDGIVPYRPWLESPETVIDFYPESECNLHELPFLNTPVTAFLMLPAHDLEWDTLRILWVVLQLILTPLTALALMQLLPQETRDRYLLLLSVLILFVWYATRQTIVFGQTSMVVSFMAVASLVMLYRGHNILAGLFLGIALCKFSMVWALPLLFLAYRRYTALAVAAVFQLLGLVLMSIMTDESLIEIPRIYLELTSEWSGQLAGVVSVSRWVNEVSDVSQFVVFVPALVLALWVIFGLYRDITFGPKRDLSTVPARLDATLLATILILISLTFVYHRYYDMVLLLMVVTFWLNLTELPERTETQERVMNLMAIPAALMVFTNLIPVSVAEEIFTQADFVVEGLYAVMLLITLGFVIWVAWKYRGELGAAAPRQSE